MQLSDLQQIASIWETAFDDNPLAPIVEDAEARIRAIGLDAAALRDAAHTAFTEVVEQVASGGMTLAEATEEQHRRSRPSTTATSNREVPPSGLREKPLQPLPALRFRCEPKQACNGLTADLEHDAAHQKGCKQSPNCEDYVAGLPGCPHDVAHAATFDSMFVGLKSVPSRHQDNLVASKSLMSKAGTTASTTSF